MHQQETPLVTSGGRRGCGYRQPGAAYLAVPLGPGGRPVEEFLIDPPVVSDHEELLARVTLVRTSCSSQAIRIRRMTGHSRRRLRAPRVRAQLDCLPGCRADGVRTEVLLRRLAPGGADALCGRAPHSWLFVTSSPHQGEQQMRSRRSDTVWPPGDDPTSVPPRVADPRGNGEERR
jgi:hypothetical protein